MKSSAFLVATYAPQQRQLSSGICIGRCRGGARRLRAQEREESKELASEKSDEEEDSSVRVEVSNSVMRMFEGPSTSDQVSVGLIEKNELKRRKKAQQQQQQGAADDQRVAEVREELFAKSDMYVPKHDNLFPLFVATYSVLCDDEDEEDMRATVDRFSSDPSRMKAIVEDDVLRMKGRSFLASQLFRDLNGKPLNAEADLRFERWFLLSMYVKFKLWWKGPSSAADVALEYAYRMCNFVFDADGEVAGIFEKQLPGFVPGKRLALRYGRLFCGKLSGQEQPSAFLDRVQRELDKKSRGWVAFLIQPTETDDEATVACMVTHASSLVFFHIPAHKAAWISYFLFLWAAATSYGVGVGQMDSVVEHCVVALGTLGVVGGAAAAARNAVASAYGVAGVVSPHFVIPVPQLGLIPSFVYYTGCLPNRACLFDISAATSIASLALSALLIIFSSSSSSGYWLSSVVVPSNVFGYSSLLSWLLHKVSAEQGGGELALSPLALGGILGLNFTLFSLLPITLSDGGRMIGACYGRRFLRSVSSFTFVLTTVSLLSNNLLLLALLWACNCAIMPEDSFQRDQLSPPGLGRKLLASLLTAAAVAAFVPVF